ncbi:MAG: AAA family ATPase [Kiritimatiellae bacterium]|nr:AAA family ATPase [Kiritimatiellia bacterium]
MAFYGREDQMAQLAALWRHPAASLVTCRGRRRIGKSTLIKHFAESQDAFFIKLEGLAPHNRMKNEDQLKAFGRQLAEQMHLPYAMPESWFDAFRWLGDVLPSGRRTVVLIDEISWMGRYDANFAGELKYAWDNRFHDKHELIVILCGSVSSWLEDTILSNTGFMGRIALDLIVRELPLSKCAQFWGVAGERISPREILDVLSVTGGVPRYLEELDPALSADENIKRMCFLPNGYLFRDFNDVFSSVFGANAPVKRNLLKALADASMDSRELVERVGAARNGRFSDVMEELEMAGFVSRNSGLNPATGRRARQDRYRLRDNYTRFYMKYIEPHNREILDGSFVFASAESLPGWDTVLGLQFENLVLNNVTALLPLLHLEGRQILSAAPFRQRKGVGSGGCQIDLLVQTRKSVCVVEIKRQSEIGEEVETQVAEKVRRLKLRDGVSVRTALVYEGRLSKRVATSGFFDALVPFGALLKQ